ncbi:glycosyltransferase [Luteococcus sp. Sow4_B9]|uniref:glycosyltransferase n=1 Tax=Luteococcus sp. Sow4_B9 TaxID=3438792 RepID=UPI003F9D099F
MSKRKLLVLWSGNFWDGLPATDHHLARALAEYVDVCWVDPTVSVHRSRQPVPSIEHVEQGVRVLKVSTVPGLTRPGLRKIAELHQHLAVRAMLQKLGPVWATMSASSRVSLPRHWGGVRVLHVTDDWVAGAPMMGLDAAWMERLLNQNIAVADVVSAVSTDLVDQLTPLAPRRSVVLVPNAATVPDVLPEVDRDRCAVLVGQLNERLDINLLEAVVNAGVTLRILGPRSDRDPEVGRRLDALLARPDVDWRGPVPHHEVVGLLASASVGITPYATNDFNRASFPLKTLEYLAIGLPVVSTPLDSLRLLDTDLVDEAAGPEAFAAKVLQRVDEPRDAQLELRRRDFADQHSWRARAETLLDAIEKVEAS